MVIIVHITRDRIINLYNYIDKWHKSTVARDTKFYIVQVSLK